MHCYVTLSNVFQLMRIKACINYSTRNLLASYIYHTVMEGRECLYQRPEESFKTF